jgi:hypothetical protein
LLAGQQDLPLIKDRVSRRTIAQHLGQADGNSAGASFPLLTRGVGRHRPREVEMTDVGEKIKKMGLDKSNLECLVKNVFPNIIAARLIDVEILPAENGNVNLFLRSSRCNYRRPVRMEEAFSSIMAAPSQRPTSIGEQAGYIG